jgi:transcriptional regulator with XRE-family HTH domain
MQKDTAINAIKKKIRNKYATQGEAALALGMSEVHLSRALNGKADPIPKKLLEFAKIKLITTHTYIHLSRE